MAKYTSTRSPGRRKTRRVAELVIDLAITEGVVEATDALEGLINWFVCDNDKESIWNKYLSAEEIDNDN